MRGLRTAVRAEGDNSQVKKGIYMCKGGGWVPGCECLKQRVDVQSGWAPRTWKMFAGKTCVPRRDVEHTGGRNEIREVFVQGRGVKFVRERDVCKDGVRNRKAPHTPGILKSARVCSRLCHAQSPNLPNGSAPAPPLRIARSSLCQSASCCSAIG